MMSSKKACFNKNVKSKKGSGNIEKEHVTCFSYDALKKIANSYNRNYALPENEEPIKIHSSKKKLWNSIRNKMEDSGMCEGEGEWCWIHQPFIKNIKDNKIHKFTFKPPIPKGKYDWLSTEDIDDVMEQYSHIIPTFKFLGTWPIDFMQLSRRKFIDNFDINQLKSQGYKRIGLVLNEDDSSKSGSHWVAVLIDIPKREAQFYDSYADPPPKEVKRWVQTINDKLGTKEKKFDIVWNNIRHQYANSECGVYSIHFLVLRALGVPFKSIVQKAISDEKMNAKRKEFFNPHDKYDNSI